MHSLVLSHINKEPILTSIFGAMTSLIFSFVDIDSSIKGLELFGIIIKDLGILAGSSVAVCSAYVYFKKNPIKTIFKKKK